MTKAEFVRWASRREKAADALRDARRLMVEMSEIHSSDPAVLAQVGDAWDRAGDAIAHLANALDAAKAGAAVPRPTPDNGGDRR